MWNLLITVAVPVIVSSYYVYQLSYNRNQSPVLWLILNLFFPFVPLGILFFMKPPKPLTILSESSFEDAILSTPMPLRFNPQESRQAANGWLLLNKYGLAWVETDSRIDEKPRVYQWSLEDVALNSKSSYRDGLISMILLPPPEPKMHPVALVAGTNFQSARVIATATILGKCL